MSAFPPIRRSRVRLIAFSLFLCAVLLGTICMQRHLDAAVVRTQNRLHRAVLVRMNEENDALRRALAQSELTAVRLHADALCGYASASMAMADTSAYSAAEQPIIDAVADTALFYAALADTAAKSETATVLPDAAFWQSAADTVTAHIAELALTLSDRIDPAAPTVGEYRAAAALSAFSASFAKDPLRISNSPTAKFRFACEPIVTPADARLVLRTLIGNAASFLGTTVTDDHHGCYIFSCQNGYAEVSRCGGHLLSYAFYPRGDINVHGIILNDSDLSELAAVFLKNAGLPTKNLTVTDDRHGIRHFSAACGNGNAITVGIRMHDGAVVSLQAEGYYRLSDE